MKSKLLIICLGLLWLPGCYLLNQGWGQLDLRFNQVPIQEALHDETNPEFRRLFNEIPRIKSFAENRLLLKKSDNYTSYYKTSREGVSFVVTASPQDELKAYTWWFPILGSVPYKGFFDPEDARALARELQTEGYDTWIFVAPAYSTLGWFKDPVTTSMMRRGQYYLVNTMFHEMTHETLFVPDQVTFNEQLAVFVAEKGTLLYYKEVHGFDEQRLKTLADRVKLAGRFSQAVREYLPRFEALYARDLASEAILMERQVLFDELEADIARRFPNLPSKRLKFNNARLLQFQRYAPDSPDLAGMWRRSEGDWATFWKLARAYANDIPDKKEPEARKVAGVIENNPDRE